MIVKEYGILRDDGTVEIVQTTVGADFVGRPDQLYEDDYIVWTRIVPTDEPEEERGCLCIPGTDSKCRYHEKIQERHNH